MALCAWARTCLGTEAPAQEVCPPHKGVMSVPQARLGLAGAGVKLGGATHHRAIRASTSGAAFSHKTLAQADTGAGLVCRG